MRAGRKAVSTRQPTREYTGPEGLPSMERVGQALRDGVRGRTPGENPFTGGVHRPSLRHVGDRAGTYTLEVRVLHRPSRLRNVLATAAGALLAMLLPLAAVAADRGAEGSVVVLATQGPVHGIGVATIVAKSGTRVRLLTAAHVASHGTLQLRLADGSDVPARLIATVPGQDLAVIEADVTEASAAVLRPASIARPQTAEPVHVWGSGNDGPAYETATVSNVGSDLPDGAPHGRYALGCALCHQGDSGAGIFNARGELVGVYIGFFEVKSGRVSVAELPTGEVVTAAQSALDGAAHLASSAAPLVAVLQTGDAR